MHLWQKRVPTNTQNAIRCRGRVGGVRTSPSVTKLPEVATMASDLGVLSPVSDTPSNPAISVKHASAGGGPCCPSDTE